MIKNWRSTFAGIAAILSVISQRQLAQIATSPEDLAIVIAGLGLILAKDAKNE
jgi:hypothetical protein